MIAERSITEAMYDRHRANPTATTFFVTRLEWQLLTHALGISTNPYRERQATLLGKPVVILEDEEMSW